MQREDLNFYLQYADDSELQAIAKEICDNTTCEILQDPSEQTLMLPVKDPISQGAFYGGEVLVCSTHICLSKDGKQSQGFAMVLDTHKECSQYIAIIDGYFGFDLNDRLTQRIIDLALKAKERKEIEDKLRNQKADSTKVQFDLM